ncbi:uncharacterized protein LOC135138434 [Zophobas morio]|uniref:uncharacterized protein LOC135138434 n=1 Tax=Zophobas morio TaxID=2755281 RepID=UPI00308363C2
MKEFLVLTFTTVLIHQCFTLTLPSTFTRCDKRKSDFNQCLSRAIQDVVNQLDKPFDDYCLPSLEHLVLKDLLVEFGNETTCIRQKYSNFKIHGFTKINTTKAELDFENQVLWLNMTSFKLVFGYEHQIRGRFIVLPIDVSTAAKATLTSPTFKMRYKFKPYLRQNEKYDKVVDSRLIMEAQNITFNYGNLFDNKRLSEDIVAQFNANWEDILQFWQAAFPQVYVNVFEKIFNDFFSRVPVHEIFDGF